MSQEPLYIQIKQYIEDRIDQGVWPVGERISTEMELTEQFAVSRMTVNKAIRDLVGEGKLERRPRLGTFVTSPAEKAQSPFLILATSPKKWPLAVNSIQVKWFDMKQPKRIS